MSDERGQPELFGANPAEAAEVSRMFHPARLTQARILRGMTKKELADLVDVSPAAIGQYEADLATPRPELLNKLARILNQDISFFAAGRPFLNLDTSDAHFRSLRSIRAADRALALTTVQQIWELTWALDRHVQFPAVNLPEVTEDLSPQEAARAVRSHWHQRRGPLKHLVATMEANGIVVVLAGGIGQVERVDAFSTYLSDERAIVMTTPRRSRDVYRHRFTCAHELGHIVLHRGRAAGDIVLEQQANEFAAELLTPGAEMRSLLPQRMDLAALAQLGQIWGVSQESLVRRMAELRVVSTATTRRAYVRLNSLRTLESEHSLYSYAGEVPRLLRDAIQLAGEIGITVRDLAAELRWRPSRVLELTGLEDPRPALRLV